MGLVFEGGQWKLQAASAGGVSLGNLALRAIDPRAWTKTDPDTLNKNVAYSSGTTTFTFNTLAAGSTNYALSGTSHSFPRFHTGLEADNGDGTYTQITTDDFALVYFRISNYTTDFASRIFVSVALDPTNNTPATMNAYGSFLYKPSTTPGCGAWDISTTTQGLNAAIAATQGVLILSPLRAHYLDNFGTNSSDGFVLTQTRALSDTLTTGQDLQLMVGVATNGSNTISDGQYAAAKLEYQAIKLAI